MSTPDTNLSSADNTVAEGPPMSAAAQRSTVQTITMLIRREFWEHRALWMAPLVIAVLAGGVCFRGAHWTQRTKVLVRRQQPACTVWPDAMGPDRASVPGHGDRTQLLSARLHVCRAQGPAASCSGNPMPVIGRGHCGIQAPDGAGCRSPWRVPADGGYQTCCSRSF